MATVSDITTENTLSTFQPPKVLQYISDPSLCHWTTFWSLLLKLMSVLCSELVSASFQLDKQITWMQSQVSETWENSQWKPRYMLKEHTHTAQIKHTQLTLATVKARIWAACPKSFSSLCFQDIFTIITLSKQVIALLSNTELYVNLSLHGKSLWSISPHVATMQNPGQ